MSHAARRTAAILVLIVGAGVGCASNTVDEGVGAWTSFNGQGDIGRVAPGLEGLRWWLDVHARHVREDYHLLGRKRQEPTFLAVAIFLATGLHTG